MGSPNIFDVLTAGREKKNLRASRNQLGVAQHQASLAEQQTALLRRQVELLEYIAATMHRLENREQVPR